MFRNRITIQRWTHSQSASGGLNRILVTSWAKWATIENRSGSNFVDRQQRDWNYDYKITTRYEKSRVERSTDTVVFDGKELEIKEVVFKDEGEKRLVTLRCSLVEDNYHVDPLTESGILVYDYPAVGGESEFQHNSMIGKRAVAAIKDGIEFTIITGGTPNPLAKEVLFNSSEGLMQWSEPFEPGEAAIIRYV